MADSSVLWTPASCREGLKCTCCGSQQMHGSSVDRKHSRHECISKRTGEQNAEVPVQVAEDILE